MGLSTTVPAVPVQNIGAATAFYSQRLGFTVEYADDGFAIVQRDEAVLHLWAASDHTWQERSDMAREPLCSGAETFLAGTASCRIKTDERWMISTSS